jgi:hypothetical protein
MEHRESPLKKFKRQPKIYINLPSKGKFYKDGTLDDNTSTDIPVFSMTANDEILYRTPDALINGEATANNIRSCIPSILDPWKVVTIDIDAILLAIRLSSYGENLSVSNVCKKCGEQNSYDIPIQKYIDFYNTLEFKDKIFVEDGLVVNVEPLTYKLWTEIQKRLIALQRTLQIQIPKITDEDQRNKETDKILTEISNLNVQIIFEHIKSIEVDGEIETNPAEILEFIQEADLSYFKKIKKHIDTQSEVWRIPPEKVQCGCGAENSVIIRVDQSDFFGRG